jgi:hypothetical protein
MLECSKTRSQIRGAEIWLNEKTPVKVEKKLLFALAQRQRFS